MGTKTEPWQMDSWTKNDSTPAFPCSILTTQASSVRQSAPSSSSIRAWPRLGSGELPLVHVQHLLVGHLGVLRSGGQKRPQVPFMGRKAQICQREPPPQDMAWSERFSTEIKVKPRGNQGKGRKKPAPQALVRSQHVYYCSSEIPLPPASRLLNDSKQQSVANGYT